MSFAFNWPRSFPASFYESSKASLEQALNSGQKLSLVADKIRVVDLNLGTIPPELDLLGIDELSTGDDGFSGRFMLSYSGDAFVSLATNLHVRISRKEDAVTLNEAISDILLYPLRSILSLSINML
jgi:distribution and morphology protein 34